MPEKTQTADRSLLDLTNFAVLFTFLFCILASNVLLTIPLIGGGLYLLGRVATMYGKWLHPLDFGELPRKQKRIGVLILSITLIIALLLIMTVPIPRDDTLFWTLLTLVFFVTVRPLMTKHRLDVDIEKNLRPVSMFWRLVLLQFFQLIPPALVLFFSVSTDTAWSLMGGYFISMILECLGIWRTRYDETSPQKDGIDEKEIASLRGVHAYRTFQSLLLVTTAALQVTMIMTYTFIGCTAGELILCMGLAFLCTGLSYSLTDLMIKKTFKNGPDPSNVLMGGLLLWFCGLLLFSANILKQSLLSAYLSLALCTCGVGLSVRVLVKLEGDMRQVAAFAIGHQPTRAYDRALHFRVEFASLCGQLLALLGITLICVLNLNAFPDTLESLARSIRPLLVVPALLLVFAALVCALLFPMTKQHLNKLHKFMELEDHGEQNPALRQQLESVVIRRSLKHYGIKMIMFIMRPFYYHRIRGRENVPNEPDVVNVFVCNHGEIYGPIVTNLYVPFSFRPWVISEMMDRDAIAQRTAEGAFTRLKWLPEKCRLPLGNAIAPIIAWIMRSVDSIPVYYQDPRKLMNTFRLSVSAMEAGDNILLFPENSADTPDHRYKLTGVSHFFTGFTMLGPLYYNKTGKCLNFVPIYADKQNRVLTFGVPTKFNPDNAPNDEKERLCDYLRGEMLRIAGISEHQGELPSNSVTG